jgi:hypothetical protein
MTSVSIPESVIEPSVRTMVAEAPKERLLSGIPSAQGVEVEALASQVELRPD